jgi:hypothetical protein
MPPVYLLVSLSSFGPREQEVSRFGRWCQRRLKMEHLGRHPVR